MKKTFEFILVLIIFYGVYTLFEHSASLVFKEPKTIWVVLVAFVFSALLLVLYKTLVGREVAQRMKKDIDSLKAEIKSREDTILEKKEEVKRAQSFKEDLIKEAEEFITKDDIS